jgi:hypothetical protein
MMYTLVPLASTKKTNDAINKPIAIRLSHVKLQRYRSVSRLGAPAVFDNSKLSSDRCPNAKNAKIPAAITDVRPSTKKANAHANIGECRIVLNGPAKVGIAISAPPCIKVRDWISELAMLTARASISDALCI